MKVTRGILREMIEAEMLNERVGIGVDVRSNPPDDDPEDEPADEDSARPLSESRFQKLAGI